MKAYQTVLFYITISFIALFSSFTSQCKNTIQPLGSLYCTNIVFACNRVDNVSDIMLYYGWETKADSLYWTNIRGDEIRIIPDSNMKEIAKVELITTTDFEHLADCLRQLQYTQVRNDLKKNDPEQSRTPKKIYSNGRKRVFVYPPIGGRTLIVFFRLTKQGYTRFGPKQQPDTTKKANRLISPLLQKQHPSQPQTYTANTLTSITLDTPTTANHLKTP